MDVQGSTVGGGHDDGHEENGEAGCQDFGAATGEISSDLYRFVQCDIKKCALGSLKLEQNCQNCD